MKPVTLDDEWSYPLHTVGTASGGYSEATESDVIKQLHAVVLEVTGKPVEAPAKARIGFLCWNGSPNDSPSAK